MSVLRILALCISAALVCASIRTAHPQIASAAALAAGIAALMISAEDLGVFSETIQKIETLAAGNELMEPYMLKVSGLAVISEFASDICRDSGETALAHRIEAGTKLGIAASALPAAAKVLQNIVDLLS